MELVCMSARSPSPENFISTPLNTWLTERTLVCSAFVLFVCLKYTPAL